MLSILCLAALFFMLHSMVHDPHRAAAYASLAFLATLGTVLLAGMGTLLLALLFGLFLFLGRDSTTRSALWNALAYLAAALAVGNLFFAFLPF